MARSRDLSSLGELPRLLIRARERAGLRQAEAAERAGLTQARVTRAERDLYPLEPEVAEAYVRALGADDHVVARVRELSDARVSARVVTRPQLVRTAHVIQGRLGGLEESATRIYGWEPLGIHRALQTEAYAAAGLSADGDGFDPGAEWWGQWRASGARLAEPGCRWEITLFEGALRWEIAPAAVMRAQVSHLLDLVEALPWLALRVVPLAGRKPTMPSGFYVYESPEGTVASVGVDVGISFLTDEGSLEYCAERHAALTSAEVTEEDPRPALRRVLKALPRK